MKKLIALIFLSIYLFLSFSFVNAAGLGDAFGTGENDPLKTVASGGGYKTESGEGQLIYVIQQGISIMLSILGVLFMIFMIYGGFVWLTSQGNDQRIDKAKGMITAAIIGLVITVASYAISVFVVARISAGLVN